MTTVFFDVDTQRDFLYPEGSLYVPGAEGIVENISALNHFAAEHQIPVVSTMDAHSVNDPEFKDWPPHCVVGTTGQHKPPSTLLDRQVVVSTAATEAPVLDGVQQVLLEKQTFDCFSNQNLPGLLDRFAADRYVVYGVVTEICVQMAAFGLLKTGRRVELVTDAIRSLRDEARDDMFRRFTAAGGVLTTTAEQMS